VEATAPARRRRGRRLLVGSALLVAAALVAAVALMAVAYAEQTEKVEALEDENAQILDDHGAIGKIFGEQAQEFEDQRKQFQTQARRLEAAVATAYRQGFAAGRRVDSLPAKLRPLARYVGAGLLVPRRLPSELDPRRVRLASHVDGYVIRWDRLAVFASQSDPLSVWTRQALAGVTRAVDVGRRRVTRLTGPSGTIYAWRSNDVTYAVVAFPSHDAAARAIIASMR
jgi:hypothetical protein